MKKIKAIFIDVRSKEISEIEIENELDTYYRLIKCDCITAPSFDEKHDVIVDDEGLLKDIEGFFEIDSECPGEYAGNGLIVGVNSNGDWTSHHLNFEEVKKHIHFIMYVRFNGQIVKIRL